MRTILSLTTDCFQKQYASIVDEGHTQHGDYRKTNGQSLCSTPNLELGKLFVVALSVTQPLWWVLCSKYEFWLHWIVETTLQCIRSLIQNINFSKTVAIWLCLVPLFASLFTRLNKYYIQLCRILLTFEYSILCAKYLCR